MKRWRPSLGAVVQPSGGVTFVVWAPGRQSVEVVVEGRIAEVMVPRGEHWVLHLPDAAPGDRYRFRLDGGATVPDPCSRSQPDGVHGPSSVVDPSAFKWSDQDFEPPPPTELVIYEAHIGTLTEEGTFDAAIGELTRLRELGVTAIELMPVAAFPGERNWGYDGVSLFAPCAAYGEPDAMRRFVDSAHRQGLAVILDVVYNHFGPDGNYTGFFSTTYLTAAHQTPWGDAVNFDQPGSAGVREFVIENLLAWHHEYHIDGFRFDATHAITDTSDLHILAEASQALSQQPRAGKRPILIAETHENDVRYLKPVSEGGFGFDAVWADDFHHVVRNLLHPEREGYLRGYEGIVEELGKTIRQGFFYEGQLDPAAGGSRGTRAREQAWRQFIYCLQNHDQVGNRALGERLHHTASLDDVRAATCLLLLLPQTPLLFQGQEFFASSPFLYFTDHEEPLGSQVTKGRRREFAEFAAFRELGSRDRIPDPQLEETFLRSKLDAADRHSEHGARGVAFHQDLLRLRHSDPVLKALRVGRAPLATTVAGNTLMVDLRDGDGKRTIYVNFGDEPASFPGDAPTRLMFCSDDEKYGGLGRRPLTSSHSITIPPHSAAFVATA